MQISFIIPIYNTPVDKLKKCFHSISSLKNIDYETILIDDGSKPYIEEFCKEYIKIKKRFMYYHIQNSGVSNARNMGIKYAKGNYISFVDSDDVIISDAFDERIFLLNFNLIAFNMVFFNKTEEVSYVLPQCDTGKYHIDKLYLSYLRDARIGGPVAKMFKRDFLVQNNIKFDTNMVVAEDADFLCEVMIRNNDFYYVNKNAYFYDYSLNTGVNRITKFPEETIENYISIYNKKIKLLEEYTFDNNEKFNNLEIIVSSAIINLFSCAGQLQKNKKLNKHLKSKILNLIDNVDYDLIKKSDIKVIIYYKILRKQIWFLTSFLEKLRLCYQKKRIK